MSISKQLLALALGACLAAPASAQESLIEVYQRALENDPAIREAEATYLATAEVKPQARSRAAAGAHTSALRARTGSQIPMRERRNRSDYGLASRHAASSSSRTRPATAEPDAIGFRLEPVQDAGQADKRVVRAETDFEAAKQDLILRVATPTSTCSPPKTISRRPSRRATAFPASSSSRNGASRSA